MAAAGADVAVCTRVVDDGGLETVVEDIKKLGRRSLGIQADTSRKADVDNMVQKVMDQFGRIDILINNAGALFKAAFLEMSEEVWDKHMDVNLKGYYLVSQAVAKRMVERKKGCIVNIASDLAFEGRPGDGCLLHQQGRNHYADSRAGTGIRSLWDQSECHSPRYDSNGTSRPELE